MDAVVLQLDPAARGSFEEHGPWHFQDQRNTQVGRRMNLGETFLQVTTAEPGLGRDFLRGRPGNGGSRVAGAAITDDTSRRRPLPAACTDFTSSDHGIPPPSTQADSVVNSSLPSAKGKPSSGFTFTKTTVPQVQLTYDFRFSNASVGVSCSSVKRARAASDVDGPNTAALGSKKRRLRKEMVTSRLSRPFSEPATHIITRQFGAGDDKHFLKVAAIMSARRMSGASSTPANQPSHPSPSSLLRRAAIVNRIRLNVKLRAVERGDGDVANLATNAALLQQNHGVGFVVGARFPVTSSSAPLLAGSGLSGGGDAEQNIPPFQLSLAAVEARPRPQLIRPKAAEGAARQKLPPSPRTRPLRSPVLRGVRPHYPVDLDEEETIDDDEVAFPTAEHESRYESGDELDDVYADFGMIFGGGGGSADDELEGETEDHYEDYLDDMDGIPWTAR